MEVYMEYMFEPTQQRSHAEEGHKWASNILSSEIYRSGCRGQDKDA